MQGERQRQQRTPLLVAVLLSVVARGEEPQQVLQLNGACNYLNFLNGLVFHRLGTTASGAPYYKATQSNYYIYYDPNCVGSGDGTARWIVDSDRPSTTKAQDLDSDGDCNFHAYVNSGDRSRPPVRDTWTMSCENDWMNQVLRLQEIPQYDNPTTTRTTTTPTTTSTSTTELPRMLRMEGACDFLKFLNSATFLLQGHTKTGAPFYKDMSHSFFIYFDPDCHGGSNGVSRWIVDNDEPNTNRLKDLDDDSDCEYHAHTDSNDQIRPPETATWSMFCDHEWVPRVIKLIEVTTTTTTTTTTTSTTTVTATESSTTTSTSLTTTTISTTSSTSTLTTVSLTTTVTSITTITDTSTLAEMLSTITTIGTMMAATTTVDTINASTVTTVMNLRTTMAMTTPKELGTTGTTSTSSKSSSTMTSTLEDEDSEKSGFCQGFSCPAGLMLRVNASELECTAAPCKEVDTETCCEEGTTTTSAARATTTTTAAPARDPIRVLLLNGVCDFQSYLNGLTFRITGTTASGAPIYKSDEKEFYIYFDEHCDGTDSKAPRWIIDGEAPDADRSADLDGDGDCKFLSRIVADDRSMPPLNATWSVYCKNGWEDAQLSLREAFARVANDTCADAGKVPITNVDVCSAAAEYFGLTGPAVQMPELPGPPGCYWDSADGRLQLVTSSAADSSPPRHLSEHGRETLCTGGELAVHQQGEVPISAAGGPLGHQLVLALAGFAAIAAA